MPNGAARQRCSPCSSSRARRCRRTISAPPASTCCRRSRSASPSSTGGSAALGAGSQPRAGAGGGGERRLDSAPHHWDAVAEALADEKTPQARLAQAVVLRHLADLAQKHPDACDDPACRTDPVTDYLERSLEADPDHLPATLDLLERYRTADSPKDWHRATDQAAQRFPGNTAILLHAVNAAVARNAYKKAVGFARQVLTLDPINQSRCASG